VPIVQRRLGHVSQATTHQCLGQIAPEDVIEVMQARTWEP